MKEFTRRVVLAAPIGLRPSWSLAADQWKPSKVVTCIIPFTPGGGTDAVFRHVKEFAARRNITMVAEYRPGAEGLIGMRAGAVAGNDGHSLTFGTIGTMSHLVDGWGAAENHQLITGLRSAMFFLITGNNSGIKSLRDLVIRLRNGDARITGGSGAPGQRMAMESFLRAANVRDAIIANYRGAAGVVQDVAGNHIQWAMVPGSVVSGQINGGQLTLLATDRRDNERDLMPAVPSIFSLIPSQPRHDGQLVAAPIGTPDHSLRFWTSFFESYCNLPETQDDIDREFGIPLPFGREFLQNRIEHWRKTAIPANI